MGLLDSVLGNVLGSALGQGQGQAAGGNNSLVTTLLPVVLSMLRGQPAGGGGLGSVLGGMLGGGSAQASGATPGMGGIGDLLRQFEQAGLGNQAASWVSAGQNLPVSADDVGRVFGNDALAKIAQQAGVSQGEAAGGLAELLPQLVDGLTPEGRLPESDQIMSSIDALTRQFGRG